MSGSSPPYVPCLDHDTRDTDGCAGEELTLCEHHHEMRLRHTESAARHQGEAAERGRILEIVRECAASEFMAGREENARLYRALASRIQSKKPGGA